MENKKLLMQKLSKHSVSIIACVDTNLGIGKDGDLLYTGNKEDLKNFKKYTQNSIIIMGRKTFESLPGRKPLPNRENIVVTRNPDFEPVEGIFVCDSIESAINMSLGKNKEIFIIGGAEIYKYVLDNDYCNWIYLTIIHSVEQKADTFFPEIDIVDWHLVNEFDIQPSNNFAYNQTFHKLIRK